MKELWTYLQVTVVTFGGWFGWALGGFDGFLYGLIALGTWCQAERPSIGCNINDTLRMYINDCLKMYNMDA
ncbi:hypothetical protein [Aquibacillus salsiterrae]|uniref:Uncharacterized protein n=1 Tax=Aquibacillus salsiterrae TaxID=2950439 RepID=A0A9X3WF44_9BACI|nr:hypothetical protein [Aquibacillus salsiterrae]MDC3418662.1 hypothetical protein [Aquibacillus salsiterrae]